MFDAAEARINRAILSKLSNAQAAFGSDDPVRAIFDAEFKASMVGVVGMGAAAPQMYVSSADVPVDVLGAPALVNGVEWVVAERRPDGESPAGLTLLVLERA
jgi:hypothetical protein